MLNSLFGVAGCPHCKAMKKAVFVYNLSAPVGEKIDAVDIHYNDPRLSFIQALYPGDMVKLPTTTIDFKEQIRSMGLTQDETVMRLAIMSVSTTEYTLNFLKMLNNDYLNLY